MPPKKKSFEESMTRLQEIASILEKGEDTLEHSIALFEEGTKLAAACAKQLDSAEQKVLRLSRGSDGAPVEHPIKEV